MKKIRDMYRQWRSGEQVIVEINLSPAEAIGVIIVIILLIVTIVRLCM